MAAISRVHQLLNDPDFKRLPVDRREALLAEFQAEDATPPPAPDRGIVGTGLDALSHMGGTAMDFVRGTNEGFYGSTLGEVAKGVASIPPGGAAAVESLKGSSEPTTSKFAHRVGQDVGAAAGFALPVGAAAKSADALVQAARLAGETPGMAIAVLQHMGKSLGLGSEAAQRPVYAMVREAIRALQSGAGAATANVVFPDSKVAEIAGQLTATLGVEGTVNALRWGARQVMGGPVLGAFTEATAKKRVGAAIGEAIPPGSAAEAGLERAVQTQETTGLRSPVAQATGSPGMAAMERDVHGRYPDVAARAQTQQARTSEVLRERVQATPGAAGGTVSGAQGTVESELGRQRAAAQAPVAAAEANLVDAHARFTQTANTVSRQMETAIADAERQATALAGQLRPADLADPTVLGDRMRTGLIEPAKRYMKAWSDTLYGMVDPDNRARGPIDDLKNTVANIVSGPRLAGLPPEVKRLAGVLKKDEGAGTMSYNTLRRFESDLGVAIDSALAGDKPDRAAARLLTQAKEAVSTALDRAAQAAPDVAERHAQAKGVFAQFAQRYLDGITAKVMARGPDAGGFKTAPEDVSALFFRPAGSKLKQQGIADWFDAAGGGPEAQRGIRDAALKSFFDRAFRSGKLDAAAAGQWQRDHAAQLNEMAARGVDLRPELAQLQRQGATVAGLEEAAKAARKRLGQGAAPMAASSVGAAEQHLTLARASADRTVQDIQNSAAQAFVGADVDKAASTLLRGDAPAQRVREVMSAAASDPMAQNGIRRALLNDALAESKVGAATATGNPLFDSAAFAKWIDTHKAAIAEAFGAQGSMHLRQEAELARQVIGGQSASVSSQAMSDIVTPEALYTRGQLFGRIYSTAKGFVGRTFLLGELGARKINAVLGGFSNEELKAVYEQALVDPKAAQTFRMMAQKDMNPAIVERRLRAHLANLGGRIAGASPSDQP